eukprot:3124900-Amphidinium_carterae.1
MGREVFSYRNCPFFILSPLRLESSGITGEGTKYGFGLVFSSLQLSMVQNVTVGSINLVLLVNALAHGALREFDSTLGYP